MPNLRMRTVRGPSSYAAGGFDVTLGDVSNIAQSSGPLVQAHTVSSSPMVAQVVATSGNIATVILRDSRSGGGEPTSGDFSALDVNIIYEGL